MLTRTQLQDQEAEKREKVEKELKALDGLAAAAAGEGEACGWLCGDAGEGRMTLADIAYFPFLERIDATIEPFKVGVVVLPSVPYRKELHLLKVV